MDTGQRDARGIAATEAAASLAKDAVRAAGSCVAGGADWHFYHGVEAAALHVLHPEMAGVRDGTAWLDAEAPSFRRGFLEASIALSAAATATEPPLRIRLPEPTAERP